MSENTEKVELSEAEKSAAAQKYKTLARAIKANDVEASRELFDLYKKQGRELSSEEVFALGVRWLTGGSKGEDLPVAMAEFLAEIGFDFKQNIILDRETENVGRPIAFRLIGMDKDEALLLELIDKGLVKSDIMDGLGDNLLVEALSMNRFDVAGALVQRGIDINGSNIGGDTPLHTFAGRLNYQAVQWLCENGADPEIENLQGARPSEMVPEVMAGWDVDSMFEALEDYVEQRRMGKGFVANPAFIEMVEKEKPKGDDDVDNDQTLGEQADAAKAILTKMGV